MRKNVHKGKKLSPELEAVRDKHIRKVDKFYRMYGGLSSDLISFEKHAIELEIRYSKRWPKPLGTTAKQLAKSWQRNKLLNEANSYVVHFYKRTNNTGLATYFPKSVEGKRLEEFCTAFITALKSTSNHSYDKYIRTIKKAF